MYVHEQSLVQNTTVQLEKEIEKKERKKEDINTYMNTPAHHNIILLHTCNSLKNLYQHVHVHPRLFYGSCQSTIAVSVICVFQ